MTAKPPGDAPQRRGRVAQEGARVPDEARLRKELATLHEQVERLQEELSRAREAAGEAGDKYLRSVAELDTIRRRHRQEQAERLQFGNAELIGRLLPVLDSFERALEHAPREVDDPNVVPEALEQWLSGLLMVQRQFLEVLEAEGVTPIEAEGQFFDPNFHQAVLAEPSSGHEDGQVIAELQRGFTLHDRLLRPSLVKVARNS
ncbi:MAG: nucleotide exchange factor GrpE [Candidatus Dormibacteria bacterium]